MATTDAGPIEDQCLSPYLTTRSLARYDMVEIRWPELRGKQVRYGDKTWELTGMVDVRGSGESLEATATEVDDVKHRQATLQFNLSDPPASLNPGNLGAHFHSLEREDDQYHIVVEKEHRTYRYEIGGLQYE